jgi:carbon-monoxide dehydrogenase large subunit
MTTILESRQKEREGPLRTEDARLLTGSGHFVDDFNEKGQAYMGLVLSPFAHAKIKRVDFSNIRSSPNFIASLTAEDLVREGVLPVSQNPWPPQRRAKRYHLALGKVRFVGEPVAAILVRNKNALEDLIEQVDVEYDTLPAVTSIDESKQKKVLLYDDWKDNISQTNQEKKGNADDAIKSASFVINVREGIRRQEAAPIEPHAVIVTYDKQKDLFVVRSTVQSVHGLREILSSELNLPKQKFHVKVLDVGGGFGSKGGPSYPWPLLACIFAKKLGIPVKFTATRTEEFLESAAGRDEYCGLTLACDKDGKIVALKANIECDVGVSGTQTHMPSLTMWTMIGPYNIPNQDLKVSAYVTNKMPIGPIRGAGAPEGCYFIERAIEIMAKKIRIDPFEFRRRNVVDPEKAQGEDYQELMDTLVKWTNYDELLQWKDDINRNFVQVRSTNPSIVGGIGISLRGSSESDEEEETVTEEGEGFFGGGKEEDSESSESSRWNEAGGSDDGSPWQKSGESGENSSERWRGESEDVTVYTGSSPHGQGHETSFAQLASEEIGVPFERIRVVWGDTELVRIGVGTFGSRSLSTGGSAVVDASRKLKKELLERASRILGVDSNSLLVQNGLVVSSSAVKEKSATIGEILERTDEDEIFAESKFGLSDMSYSSGVHLCALTIDTETGKVKILKYFVTEDCGRIINKSIVEGQIQGGVIHGVGGALLEGLEYDEQGNLLTTTFMDYSIPTSMESPNVEISHRVTPSIYTLHGGKGVGESGTIGSYAAVINALNDALSQLTGKNSEVNTVPALLNSVYYALRSR